MYRGPNDSPLSLISNLSACPRWLLSFASGSSRTRREIDGDRESVYSVRSLSGLFLLPTDKRESSRLYGSSFNEARFEIANEGRRAMGRRGRDDFQKYGLERTSNGF